MVQIIRYQLSFCLLFFLSLVSYGQDVVNEKDTITNYSFYNKSFKMGALFVAEYKRSLTDDVDMNGLHNAAGVDSRDGTFLRYIRISGNYQLNDKISASVLVNLADFKEDPRTRVLENAFVKYAFSDYLNVIFGQFRPFFGLEDLYPYEFGRSYVWSNQYTEFGRNGWQSFQLGIAATGSFSKKGIPLKYYLSIVNGNGKNRNGDDDMHKVYTARLDYKFGKILTLGVNGGFTKMLKQKADAYGVDMEFEVPIAHKWAVSMDAEYKKGTNFLSFKNAEVPDKALSDYRMEGIYVTPKLEYNIGLPRLRKIQFSTRYEYFDSLIQDGNPRTTVTPFVGFMLADKYHARLCLGLVFDKYRTEIPNTKQWNSNFMFSQVQFKF